MIGAIIGDIVGSRFEWNNHRSKDFELFTPECFATDDSIMTLAIGKAIMESRADWSDLGAQAVRCMREVGCPYPGCGYGGRFYDWMYSNNPQPYNSFGNGAAMRVSACGFAAKSIEEAKLLSRLVTEVTHNHPEGIRGAEATAVAVYMARTGCAMAEIREVIDREYYSMDFTLDSIRESYRFNETCRGTVPQALMAFFESVSFEDAIRNAVSIGGDSDTLAAITGGIAEAYFGVPKAIRSRAEGYLDNRLKGIYHDFEQWILNTVSACRGLYIGENCNGPFCRTVSDDLADGEYPLYKSASRSLYLRIRDGELSFFGEDFGNACRMMNGKDEYEFCYHLDAENARRFIARLRLRNGLSCKLGIILKDEFGKNDGSVRFKEFCDAADVETHFSSY